MSETVDANAFAYAALIVWLPITLGLMLTLRPQRAVTVSLLGAWLFLPQLLTFDAPLLPPLGKEGIAAVAAFLRTLSAAQLTRRLALARLVFRAARRRCNRNCAHE